MPATFAVCAFLFVGDALVVYGSRCALRRCMRRFAVLCRRCVVQQARYVADAVVILENTPRRAAKAVRKAIESATANLLQSGSIDTKTIYINRISVTAGTRMRRYVPASRGRALPYEKISSNIFVEVCGEEKAKKAPAKKEEAKAEKKENLKKTLSIDFMENL